MTIYFGNHRKWMLKGLGWFSVSLLTLFSVYLEAYINGQVRPAVLIIQLVAVMVSVYQGIQDMKKPQKAYVQANTDGFLVHRSSWTPRERINYDSIKNYYSVSELFVFQLKNGKETQFDLEPFSNSEVKGIKRIVEVKVEKQCKRGDINE